MVWLSWATVEDIIDGHCWWTVPLRNLGALSGWKTIRGETIRTNLCPLHGVLMCSWAQSKAFLFSSYQWLLDPFRTSLGSGPWCGRGLETLSGDKCGVKVMTDSDEITLGTGGGTRASERGTLEGEARGRESVWRGLSGELRGAEGELDLMLRCLCFIEARFYVSPGRECLHRAYGAKAALGKCWWRGMRFPCAELWRERDQQSLYCSLGIKVWAKCRFSSSWYLFDQN